MNDSERWFWFAVLVGSAVFVLCWLFKERRTRYRWVLRHPGTASRYEAQIWCDDVEDAKFFYRSTICSAGIVHNGWVIEKGPSFVDFRNW